MTVRPRDRRRAEVLGIDRLHIFVPAIMSVGLIFWLVSEARDLVRSSGEASRDKRSRIAGHAVARMTTAGTEADPPARRGLRPRPVYLLMALTLVGGALYVTIGSIANYARDGGYVADIAWLLGAAVAVSSVALVYGIAAAIVFARWPAMPPSLARLLMSSPLTTRPTADGEPARRPAWWIGAAFMACAAAAGLLSLVIAASPHVVDGFDEQVAAWFAGLDVPGWSSVTDLLFRTETAVVLVGLVGLAAVRCRALAIAYAAATGFGLLANVVVRQLVERTRPPDGPLPGWTDSYPSGHVIQAVVIAALVPLAVATLTRRWRVMAPLHLVLGVALVGAAVGRVADGLHWPTDVIGGALIGLTLAFGAAWIIANDRAHSACRGCPWSHPSQPPEHVRGFISLDVSAAALVRVLAHLSSVVVVVALGVMTLTVGLPANTEGYVFPGSVERPVQLALAGLVSVGSVLSWKWEAIGAVVIALAATCLGIFAAIQYPPTYALAMASGTMIPAVLLWLSWQHRRTPLELSSLAVVTLLLLGTTWFGANHVYDSYFGPTHPDSTAAVLVVDRVEWMWSGGLRTDGIAVTARLSTGHDEAQLIAKPADGSVELRSSIAQRDDHRVVRLELDGLEPGTAYAYRLVVDGVADTSRGIGTFHTPEDGPMSFRVALGACARTGSNGAVFDAIAAEDPLFYLMLGDIHYGNIDSTPIGPHLGAFDRLLTEPGQAALYRSTPIAYVWDDHDYGPNDSDASAPGRKAVREAYRRSVPSYPVAPGDAAINQAFTIGRVRFVLTDSRSEQDATTMLGQEQLDWLIDELTTASRTHAVVVWANSVPWIAAERAGADGWAGHPVERRAIAEAISAADIDNLLMVSGDAHMVAIDDGTNSDYSTDGDAGFPVLHAAALDRPGSVKGGPYSEGVFPGGGRYGLLEIDDSGNEVTVTLSGRTWDGQTLVELRYPVEARPPA